MSLILWIGIVVFFVIAIRHLLPIPLKYWHIMFFGSLAYIITGSITFKEAVRAVDFDVLLSLFGMFSLGYALEESRYLGHLFYKVFKKSKNVSLLVFQLVFVFGFASAFFMNDTIAVVGVPLIVLLNKNYGIDLKFLTLTLAFSVTTGSILSPLGNPQNLLIALSPGFLNPFVEFFKFFILPTILCLLVLYFYMRFLFREEFHSVPLTHSQEPIKDKRLKRLSKISLIVFFSLIFIEVLDFFLNFGFRLRISLIPIISVAPIYLFYPRRLKILKGVDYDTLLFFIFMFIVTETLTKDRVFTSIFSNSRINPLSHLTIVINGIILSQIISNVPFTIFYLKVIRLLDPPLISLITLAFASTIAGNLTVLGAASNIIILQNLEKRVKRHVVNFFEFMKFGAPLTIIQVLIYFLCMGFYHLLKLV